MDHSLMLQTKFMVPRPSTDLIERPDLLARLQKAVFKRLTLLSATAGYGKTTLLADFTTRTPMPFAWYQLDSADGDPTIFLSYLTACAQQIEAACFPDREPRLGRAVMALLEDGDPPPPERILIVFINEVAAHLSDDFLFILEDYHLVTNPHIHELVNILLDSGPPQLHLIISSRTDPPLTLGRLRAGGQLAEFRAADLRFAQAEVLSWLERLVPGTAAGTAHLLNEKTEGWAAALQIILSALVGKDVHTADRFIADLTGTQRFIFEYLAEEVFQQHSEERQQFLIQTAVFDQMNADGCNALLETENAQLILDGLERDNLFIVSLDEHQEWYRYHHLFRQFLLGKLRRESTGLLPELEEKAGRYYLEQGIHEAAFSHFIRAKNFDAAADALSIFAPDYVERGRISVLQRYLGDLPADILHQRPELLLQHGNVLWQLGRSGTAVARYEDARAAFERLDETAGVCRVLTQMAELCRSQGDYRQAHSLAQSALEMVGPQDHARRAKTLMVLAKSEGFLTGMDRGHALALKSVVAARLAGDSLSRRARANLLRSLGHICWWYGDPEATLRYCQEALTLVSGKAPIAAKIYLTMATPYVYRRDLKTALYYARKGLAIADQLQLLELLPRAHVILGSILSRRGDHEEGEVHLRQAVDFAQGLGLESYARVIAVGYLAQNLCSQGRIDEARQLAEAVLWERAANPDTYEMVVTRSVLADIKLESGDLEGAQAVFEELEEICRRRQFRIPLSMVYFGLAYINLRQGRLKSAADYARQSVDILEPLHTLQLFLDQGERARNVCECLVHAGQATPFVAEVLKQLPPKPTCDIKVAKSTIEVKCMGRFRVTVDGSEITQEQWVSTKARDMLAYFVTFRDGRIPLEKATADIWPDHEQGGRAFHSALYRLRRALRRDNTQKEKFICVTSGEYWLDKDRFKIDVVDFEAAVRAADQFAGSESQQWRQKAIALYEGDFLPNFLYYDWVTLERQRLQQKMLRVLAEEAGAQALNQNHSLALDLINRAIQIDSLCENYYCQAMEYYADLRDRGGLIRCYQALTLELQSGLNMPPSIHTQQHYQRLLSIV